MNPIKIAFGKFALFRAASGFRAKTDLFFRGGFQYNNYGTYGAELTEGSRDVNFFDLGTSLESTLSSSTTLSATYDVTFLDLKTDTVNNTISEFDIASVIIASSGYRDEIYEQIKWLEDKNIMVFKY